MQQPFLSQSLHSPARACPTTETRLQRLLACTLIISHFSTRCSPGHWALRPSSIKAPTSQQVIPATPPIAICRQTVQACDAPHLLLRADDVVRPLRIDPCQRAVRVRTNILSSPITTITIVIRLHRRLHLDFHSFGTPIRPLRSHYI